MFYFMAGYLGKPQGPSLPYQISLPPNMQVSKAGGGGFAKLIWPNNPTQALFWPQPTSMGHLQPWHCHLPVLISGSLLTAH